MRCKGVSIVVPFTLTSVFAPPVPVSGFEPGFCMMCTMQNHIIQVFANSGNVIKPIGVLNELKSKYVRNCSDALLLQWLLQVTDRRRCANIYA